MNSLIELPSQKKKKKKKKKKTLFLFETRSPTSFRSLDTPADT